MNLMCHHLCNLKNLQISLTSNFLNIDEQNIVLDILNRSKSLKYQVVSCGSASTYVFKVIEDENRFFILKRIFDDIEALNDYVDGLESDYIVKFPNLFNNTSEIPSSYVWRISGVLNFDPLTSSFGEHKVELLKSMADDSLKGYSFLHENGLFRGNSSTGATFGVYDKNTIRFKLASYDISKGAFNHQKAIRHDLYKLGNLMLTVCNQPSANPGLSSMTCKKAGSNETIVIQTHDDRLADFILRCLRFPDHKPTDMPTMQKHPFLTGKSLDEKSLVKRDCEKTILI